MIRDMLHVKAPGNWMNDPNGFICYQGNYHLFYQHFPYAPQWGTMHWGHAVSRDLVHWEHRDLALFPTKDYDRNGVFSGSALEKDNQLYLYYSAVRYLQEDEENIHRAKEGQFETCQAMIVSRDGVHFDNWKDKKRIIPVIRDDEMGDSTHTRDPKVWKSKDTYYMVLGSTFQGKEGRVLFYKSPDAVHWEYANQYRSKCFGTILECPDLFWVDDTCIFIGSPIGISEDGLNYGDHAICTLAGFQEESCELKLTGPQRFVDVGLDLYAPQTTLDMEGRRVMVAWMRMPKSVEDETRGPWNGIMCSPRVVSLRDGHICFEMHPNIDRSMSRRVDRAEKADFQKPFRIKTIMKDKEILDIGGYRIWVEDDSVWTDRSRVFAGIEGYRMQSRTPGLNGRYKLDILAEPNLIEVFVNDGEYVISHVVYGLGNRISGPADQIFTEIDR